MATSFDTVSHDCLIGFVEHRVGDRRVVRLIRKWLKAGVAEDGEIKPGTVGTPQGAVISPLLANIYLHDVFDQWAHQWRQRHAHGDVIMVRYADDIVVGFQHRDDAERFLAAMRDRLAAYALTLHGDKTRLIRFGRFAAQNRKERGEGKPETPAFAGAGCSTSLGSPTSAGAAWAVASCCYGGHGVIGCERGCRRSRRGCGAGCT